MTRSTTDPTQKNVDAVAKLEGEALHARSLGERLSDAIVRVVGSMGFVLGHVIGFVAWVPVNLGLLSGVPVFDPFPFGILTLVVSAEGVLLGIFILVSQNRMIRQADRRAHLDLQIGLLAEQESTKVLQMLERLSQRLGVDVAAEDPEVQQFIEQTDLDHLVTKLRRNLPDDS